MERSGYTIPWGTIMGKTSGYIASKYDRVYAADASFPERGNRLGGTVRSVARNSSSVLESEIGKRSSFREDRENLERKLGDQ